MAIQFKEMRPYLARNVRISLCFEETYEYFNYLLKSDIPNKYGELYVYGVGTADVEFSRDVFVEYDETKELNHSFTLYPAIEIFLSKHPRDIQRSKGEYLLFKDLKPYLQIGMNFLIENTKDHSSTYFLSRNEISDDYDDLYVYGISMDIDYNILYSKISYSDHFVNSITNNDLIIVLSNHPRGGIKK